MYRKTTETFVLRRPSFVVPEVTMLTADIFTTAMVALFLALFTIAFIWARRTGQFQEMEQVKFKLFEDEHETRYHHR